MPDTRLSYGAHGDELKLSVPDGGDIDYDGSKKLIRLIHGSTDDSIAKTLKHGPLGTLDRAVLTPGKTRASGKGLYAVPIDRASTAREYAQMGRYHKGSPATLEFDIPANKVTRHGYETLVPRDAWKHITNVKVRSV